MDFQQISERKTERKFAAVDQLFALQDVNKTFDSIDALRNVHFQVKTGEIVFITGHSGAGKTTLLRILAGEIGPDQGVVHLPSRQHSFVARVFQDLKLKEKASCRENIWQSYDRRIYQNKNEFSEDLENITNICGIARFLDVQVKNANGGLKQMVALIRALMSRPDVLILDEPTCSMDKESARKVFDILNLYNIKQSLTVIWASHNSDLVKTYSGRIVHLDKGRLVYSGHACFI